MTPITFDQPTSSIEGYFVGEINAPTITNALSTLSIHDVCIPAQHAAVAYFVVVQLIAVHRATRASSVVPRVTVMARVNVNTTTWRMEYELKTEATHN